MTTTMPPQPIYRLTILRRDPGEDAAAHATACPRDPHVHCTWAALYVSEGNGMPDVELQAHVAGRVARHAMEGHPLSDQLVFGWDYPWFLTFEFPAGATHVTRPKG